MMAVPGDLSTFSAKNKLFCAAFKYPLEAGHKSGHNELDAGHQGIKCTVNNQKCLDFNCTFSA